MTEGEAQKTGLDELLGKMDVAEQGLKEIFPNGDPSFEEEKPGYLDIVFYSLYGTHEAADEILGKKFGQANVHCPVENVRITLQNDRQGVGINLMSNCPLNRRFNH